MSLPLLLVALLAPAAQAADAPIRVTGHAWAPFISPMGEPFRPKGPSDDTLADWFYQADRNRDGILTQDEMIADADRFFATLDTNHDGEIDPDELVHYEWEIAPDIQLMSRMKRKPGDPVPAADARQADPDDSADSADRPDRGHWRRGSRSGGGEQGDSGGRHRRGPDDGGVQGAARYALLNIPEPVAAADADFNRAISLVEFRQAAAARFQLLDVRHEGKLTLQELEALRPATPVAGKHPKRDPDAADTRVGNPLPPGN